MSLLMKSLGIDQMEPEKRIELALEIWESLGENRPANTLTPDQKKELDRRDAELDENPSIALTWEQIRQNIETKS